MRPTLLLVLALAAAPASAEDCAKFADALAYNACLARQGPAARAVAAGPAPASKRPARSRYVAGRHGRSEWVFSIGR